MKVCINGKSQEMDGQLLCIGGFSLYSSILFVKHNDCYYGITGTIEDGVLYPTDVEKPVLRVGKDFDVLDAYYDIISPEGGSFEDVSLNELSGYSLDKSDRQVMTWYLDDRLDVCTYALRSGIKVSFVDMNTMSPVTDPSNVINIGNLTKDSFLSEVGVENYLGYVSINQFKTVCSTDIIFDDSLRLNISGDGFVLSNGTDKLSIGYSKDNDIKLGDVKLYNDFKVTAYGITQILKRDDTYMVCLMLMDYDGNFDYAVDYRVVLDCKDLSVQEVKTSQKM